MSNLAPTTREQTPQISTSQKLDFATRLVNFLSSSGQIVGLSAVGFVYMALILLGTYPSWIALVCAYLLIVPVYTHDYTNDRKGVPGVTLVLLYPAIMIGILAMVGTNLCSLLVTTWTSLRKPIQTHYNASAGVQKHIRCFDVGITCSFRSNDHSYSLEVLVNRGFSFPFPDFAHQCVSQ